MSKIRKKPKRKIKARIRFLIICSIGALAFVGIFKVVMIKANNGNEYEKNAIENQMNKVQDKIINPNRGTILDRNGQAIAISSTVFNIALDIRVIAEQKEEKIDSILAKVSEILEIDLNELKEYFIKDSNGALKPENDKNWKIIKKKVPYDTAKILEKEKLVGVHLEADTERNYPHNNLAAQTIGFIMGDTSWGLESSYNEDMTGTPGRIYRAYEENDYVVTKDIEPIKGNDIVTTIDITLQQYAEEIVEKTYKNLSATYTPEVVELILMNPKTGEMLAIAQYPTFDANDPSNLSIFSEQVYKDSFETLTEEEQLKIRNSTWKNFAISDTLEPGSTFKSVTVAAGLEEGVISPNETFYCEGYRNIGGYKIRCHKRDGHGSITLTQSLAKSCNLAMIDISNKLGREKFYKYQKDFGFGYKTGIDLYGEVDASSLIIPVEKLNSTELATSSFGQTFTASPMQSIVAFAASINGGNIMKPYIVSQIIDDNGNVIKENSPTVVRKVISEETSDFLKNAMITTLEEGGTGAKANIPGYNIGGKTGTAQQDTRSKNIYSLSFAAYLPAEDPEYLALAIIHRPKDYIKAAPGTVSPSPMIKEYFEKIIEYKVIPPSNPNSKIKEEQISPNNVVIKDYANKDLKSTIKELNLLGINFQLVGSGGDTVVKQIPPANTKMDKNSKILLYIESKNDSKELTSVPDTVGLSMEEAKNLIEQMGFEVSIEQIEEAKKDEKAENTTSAKIQAEIQAEPYSELISNDNTEKEKINTKKVLEQMPEAGVFIEKGNVVKIKVK